MPGTTHARAAQTVTLGHHLLAHAWALLRDLERFDQWAVRSSVSPLGAGALATSTLGLDPAAAAARLGFERPFDNSIDAVSDRDFVQEFLADAAICATHLSRLAADLARWTDPAVGWAELDEAYTTGSSIMPQKRNPDTAELARAKAARIAAGFAALTSVLHGLAARVPPRPPGGQGAGVRCRRHARAGPARVGRGGRDRAVRRRGDARGRVGGGPLRDGPRRSARAPRGAVPRGASPDGRAAEAARRGVAFHARSLRRGVVVVRGSRRGRRCWTRTPPFARGAAWVGRRRRASSSKRTRSGCGSRRARRSRRGPDRPPAGPPRARGER